MKIHTLVSAALTAAVGVSAASAATVVYSEDFESVDLTTAPGPAPAGYTVAGGFNGSNVINAGADSANATPNLFFDVGFGAAQTVDVDTGVAAAPGTVYAFTADYFAVDTGGANNGNDFEYVGDFTYTLVAGGDVLATGTVTGGPNMPIALTATTGAAVSGNLELSFVTVSTGDNDSDPDNTFYEQVEIDNLVLTAAPIPEPASLAALGLAGLALRRRR